MADQITQGDQQGRRGNGGWERWLVGRLVPVVTAVLTIVTTALGIVATNQKRQIEALDSQLQAELKRSAEVRAERESLEKLRLTLYQEVHKVLSAGETSRDSRVVGATATLVRHLSVGEFRDGLLKALEANSQSDEARAEVQYVQAEAQTADRAREQAALPEAQKKALREAAVQVTPTAPRWLNWDVDFFWCEGTPGADARARSALEKVRALDSQASGRWRVRMLPRTRNDAPGYGVRRDEIRVDAGNAAEKAIGTALQSALATETGRSFTLVESSQGTSWYLSTFFCAR